MNPRLSLKKQFPNPPASTGESIKFIVAFAANLLVEGKTELEVKHALGDMILSFTAAGLPQPKCPPEEIEPLVDVVMKLTAMTTEIIIELAKSLNERNKNGTQN